MVLNGVAPGDGSAMADRCVCVLSGELGVALSGGGARALAQLGVLKVLEREGVPVSYVAGTSGGAVVGAVYVTSRDAREAEDRVLAHLRAGGIGFTADTFAALGAPGASLAARALGVGRTLWRATMGSTALVGGGEMRASLARLLGPASFGDARLPFATTALDLTTGRRLIFAGGPLVDAVYASSAIPGWFEPFALQGHVLVDGSWAEPVPVETCRHLGAIHVLAVDVGGLTPAPAAGAVASALRADGMARQLLEERQLRAADFVVRPDAPVRHFADFGDPAGAIAAGQLAAENALAGIAAVLERHRSLFVRPVAGPARVCPHCGASDPSTQREEA